MMRRLSILGAVLCVTVLAAAQGAQQSDLSFVVVKDNNGKPVKYASVIMHPVDKDGKQAKGGSQVKTDSEGKTAYSGVPYGKVRVQVIARGFQTYGEDFDINQPKQEITIRLKPPQDQYSIYK